MKRLHDPDNINSHINRRDFLRAGALVGGAAAAGLTPSGLLAQEKKKASPFATDNAPVDPNTIKTNIDTAMAVPKSAIATPGLYPGRVTEVHHPESATGINVNPELVPLMLTTGMKNLTGADKEKDAWAALFKPEDVVGITPNPVGGRFIGTTHFMVQAVIKGLESAGVPRSNIIIWDHYEDQLRAWGYSEKDYPGIAQECHHYTVKEGEKSVPKGLDRLDMDVFYEADYTLPEDKNPLMYMINHGTKSYYPKVITQKVDKIINIPVLKHHSRSLATMAMKNLSFAATSNCIRGHDFIDRYIAETCAFPAIRDKTVLNIMEAFRAQYDAGPGFSGKHVWNDNRLYLSTDMVAIDTIGYEVLWKKRVEAGVSKAGEKEAVFKVHDMLVRAEKLDLGIHKSKPIDHRIVNLT